MKRIVTHRFLIITVLCILACAGCANKGSMEKKSVPEDDSLVTVTEATDGLTGDESAAESPDSESADQKTEIPDTTTIIMDAEPSDAPPVVGAESGDAATALDRPTYDELQPCREPIEEASEWLDRSHTQVYQTICGTVAWFDGFFGDRRYDAASRETAGRISASGFWDQYDGFDPRFRFRAKLALPALNDRTNLLIGRGDEREFIEGQQQTPSDSIPSNFNRVEDDSFLFGLGYQRGTGLKRGFDLSVGIKVRAPPEPYVKAKYRRAWEMSEATLLRMAPVIYWKMDEGFGTTLSGNIDHLLTEKLMFRWSASGNISEDKEIEGVAWNNWLSLFQALANRKAISYHAFVLGETKAEVETQNFGFEMRFRRRIFRKWLFLDVVSSVSWPRFLIEEEREINFGIGAGFEMYFGPVPDAQMR